MNKICFLPGFENVHIKPEAAVDLTDSVKIILPILFKDNTDIFNCILSFFDLVLLNYGKGKTNCPFVIKCLKVLILIWRLNLRSAAPTAHWNYKRHFSLSFQIREHFSNWSDNKSTWLSGKRDAFSSGQSWYSDRSFFALIDFVFSMMCIKLQISARLRLAWIMWIVISQNDRRPSEFADQICKL